MDISHISSEEIDEICWEYRMAASPSKQIKISSELHLLTPEQIKAVLQSKGYLTPRTKKRTGITYITHKGKTQTIAQWSADTGVSVDRIRDRYRQGLPPEEIFAPTRHYQKHKEGI